MVQAHWCYDGCEVQQFEAPKPMNKAVLVRAKMHLLIRHIPGQLKPPINTFRLASSVQYIALLGPLNNAVAL